MLSIVEPRVTLPNAVITPRHCVLRVLSFFDPSIDSADVPGSEQCRLASSVESVWAQRRRDEECVRWNR